MATRVLTECGLNRALLARQLLLERKRIAVPRAVEQLGGLQTQYAPSAYIGLWSRLEGFKRDDLAQALERRRVIQGTLMRITIHMVSKRDYWPIALAVRRSRRDAWLRQRRGRTDAQGIKALAGRVRTELAEAPRQRSEITAAADSMEWNRACLWVDLVRVPPSGTWERRRADLYGLAEDWSVRPATRRRRKASSVSFAATSAASGPRPPLTSRIGRALRSPRSPARSVVSRFAGSAMSTAESSLTYPVRRSPTRRRRRRPAFLPTWDATLLAHARRTGILPERFRPRVFQTATPQSVSTFLVDGRVAGTWKHERGRIKLEPFERLAAAVKRELDGEAERLAEFHA